MNETSASVRPVVIGVGALAPSGLGRCPLWDDVAAVPEAARGGVSRPCPPSRAPWSMPQGAAAALEAVVIELSGWNGDQQWT